jgi:hypothetical protein
MRCLEFFADSVHFETGIIKVKTELKMFQFFYFIGPGCARSYVCPLA